MTMSEPESTPVLLTKVLWVRNEAGRARVRWLPVCAYVVTFTTIHLLAAVAISWYADTAFAWAPVIAIECGALAYLLLAIEMQREAIVTGKWRLRLSLRTCFLLLLLACVFIGAVSNHVRTSQQQFAANRKLTAELEDIIGTGRASITTLHGTKIGCVVLRKTFNDSDLARLIDAATKRTGECELTMLLLENSCVTNNGVAQLANCPKLTMLALPAIALNDDAIGVIGRLSHLEYLLVDEKVLEPAQREALQRALPQVKFNGKPWSQAAP